MWSIYNVQADDSWKIVAEHWAGNRKHSVLYTEIGVVTSRRMEQYSQFTRQGSRHSVRSDLCLFWYAILSAVYAGHCMACTVFTDIFPLHWKCYMIMWLRCSCYIVISVSLHRCIMAEWPCHWHIPMSLHFRNYLLLGMTVLYVLWLYFILFLFKRWSQRKLNGFQSSQSAR